MSVEYKPKRFYFSEQNIKYVQDYKNLKETGDDSTALRLILNEHREMKNHLFDLNYITAALKNELIQELEKVISDAVLEEIRRVRLGTNNTDRNTQVLIELLTSWMVQSNIDAIFSTDKVKPDFLKFAESVVSTRITHKKQKKDAKNNPGAGGNVNANIQ